jgi:hypothetical protein
MTKDDKDLALNISVDNLFRFTTDIQTVLLELETLRNENKRLKEIIKLHDEFMENVIKTQKQDIADTISTFINNCNNSRQLIDINIKNLTP